MRAFRWLLITSLLNVSQAWSQEDLERALGGFDEIEPSSDAASSEATPSDRPWRLSGDAYLAGSINYAQAAPNAGQADPRGLSKLRAGGHLILDAQLLGLETRVSGVGFRDLVYPIKKREEFTHAVLQSYEADLELHEAWVRASPLSQLDIKVGRQIVAWGRSETLRVVDVLNPIDNREPGVIDLADMRLPVAMSRLDYYVGPLSFTGIAIHESRLNKEPVPGSDFFPMGFPLPGFKRPANGGNDTEWAAAITGRFQGWDAALHWARVYEDRPRLDPDTGSLAFSRITLAGVTGNYARGNWLLKGELARSRGLRYFGVPGRRFARSDALLGVEYSGFRSASLVIDVVGRKLHGFEHALQRVPDLAQELELETAIRCTTSHLNDSLRVTVIGVLFGEWGNDGSAYRASATYELGEGLSAEVGLAVYEGGDAALFDFFDPNDRVFFLLRQSF